MKYKEIFYLKTLLDEAKIPYCFEDRSFKNFDDDYEFYQIIIFDPSENLVPNSVRLISVVEGYGTYGSESYLLEIMGCLTEQEYRYGPVKGNMTAVEVFARIKEYF